MKKKSATKNLQNKIHLSSDELAKSIHEIESDSGYVTATLATDEKVIARITDGIYRQPASALRELISNAYDADATDVTILTDYPQFEQIVVRDNGNGMGEEALANLILHIGGSAKRGNLGKRIGVTNSDDSTKTIAGRNIIGKIGIGLFSVAQLTQQFQIITKVQDKNYRLVADVTLRTFIEDESADDENDGYFESGKVSIRKVKAADTEAHGTDIVLLNLRKNALAILRSEDIWTKSDSAEKDGKRHKYSPTYHIGQYKKESSSYFSQRHEMNLPWDSSIVTSARFKCVYDSVLNEFGKTRATPTLENTFDNYFQMVWTLALSSPLNYIEKHPFELEEIVDEPLFFQLSNTSTGQAEPLNLENNTYKKLEGSRYPLKDPAGGFNVYIDGMRLYRPISFNKQKKSGNALKKPLMFYGHYKADYGKEPNELTGGELEFEAYFYWNSKILPLDHNGISIRINNASGTLFDSRWLGYPVAEKTTLGQITAEVFVIKGLDAALNIDRESFNYAHPHYQILSRWVYSALRQVTAKQKSLRSKINKDNKIEASNEAIKALYKTDAAVGASSVLEDFPEISDNEEETALLREQGRTAFSANIISCNNHTELTKHKIQVIIAILQARGLINELSYFEQEALVKDIAEILTFGDSAHG